MLIDTHCHLHDREFFEAEKAEEILERARKKGVQKIVCIGTDHKDSLAAGEFAAAHDDVYWTYGVHPENAHLVGRGAEASIAYPAGTLRAALAKSSCPLGYTMLASTPKSSDNDLRMFRNMPFSNYLIAIGEVGLDYHYSSEHKKEQIALLNEMLQLATDWELPVSLHVREAFDDFFPVIANFPKIRGVVHSFSDSKKNLKRILTETDFYVGVNGLATYSTLPTPPLERILLETDAPFLTPRPFRGIINESTYIPEIAEWLGEKLGVESKIIEKETTKNARELFHF